MIQRATRTILAITIAQGIGLTAVLITHAASAAAGAGATGPAGARGQIDPYLFPEIRDSVERAAKAESDPSRGTGNALEILRGRRAEIAADARLAQALDLRIAGTVIRAHFLSNAKVPLNLRWEQALSTFSRLDLTEPGLATWIQEAAKQSPTASQGPLAGPLPRPLKSKPFRRPELKAVIMARGAHLDRTALERQLEAAFVSSGINIAFVPAAKAEFVLKISAEDAVPDARSSGAKERAEQRGNATTRERDVDAPNNNAAAASDAAAQRYVRVTLDIERIEDGRLRWRHSIFRTSAAPRLDVALDASVDWVLRIGGRDILFRWLGETAFPGLLAYGTGQGGQSPPNGQAATANASTTPTSGPRPTGIHAVGHPSDRRLRVTLPKPTPTPTPDSGSGPTPRPTPVPAPGSAPGSTPGSAPGSP